MKTTRRILLADDHEVVRRGMRALLESEPGFEIVGEVRTGREAVSKAQELNPDVIVMDVGMPELNGLDATRQIRKLAPSVEVVIVSQHEYEQLPEHCREAGARGYTLKSECDDTLLSAVKAVSLHQPFFGNKDASAPNREYLAHDHRHSLTTREREVVQLLAEGKSSKEVAAALAISVKTAETHRANVMRKLSLHSVSDLVRYAIRNNIAQP
jgi:DNA-binding NarL/FixJ family response regulator